jgi:hypothetical protein
MSAERKPAHRRRDRTSDSSDPEAGITTTALLPERQRSCSQRVERSASSRLESDCRSAAKRNCRRIGCSK